MDRARDLRHLVSILLAKRCPCYGSRKSMKFGVLRTKGTIQNAKLSVLWGHV